MIETVPIEDGEAVGYRLPKAGFYLPYLSLASLVLEPDKLAMIVQAADCTGRKCT